MLSPRTERPCGVVSGVVARCCPDKHLSSKLSRLRRADKSGDKFVSICRKNCLHYSCLHGAATFVQAGPIVSDVVSVHVADMTRKCGRQKKDTKKIIVPPTRGRGIKRKITPQQQPERSFPKQSYWMRAENTREKNSTAHQDAHEMRRQTCLRRFE